MMRKDSPLLAFYYDKLPSKKEGGVNSATSLNYHNSLPKFKGGGPGDGKKPQLPSFTLPPAAMDNTYRVDPSRLMYDKFNSPFIYNDYYEKASKYLSRPIFKGTTLTAKDIADVAQDFYKVNKYVYPLDLLLTQGQIETQLGKTLKSENNFFNVGNTDSGKTKKFKSPKDSVQDYMNLMYNDYLNRGKKSPDELLKPNSFVNYAGNRYASNPNYETQLANQRSFIQGLLKKDGGSTYNSIPRFDKGGKTCPKGYINIDGECVKKDSRKYKDMLDKGQVGTMQNGVWYSNKSNLQPIVIASSRDKDTQEFYNKLKQGDLEQYEALVELSQKYGSPHVSLKDKAGWFDSKYDEDSPNSNKFRPNFNPITGNINLGSNSKDLIEDYISELAHRKQWLDKGSTDFQLRGIKQLPRIIKNYLDVNKRGYEEEYDIPGSIEYEAHEEIEPIIQKQFDDLSSGKLWESSYYEYPGTYEFSKPTYKIGGNYFPKFLEGGNPCYDAQGNPVPCDSPLATQNQRLKELGSDAYTAMQPFYNTLFEAANKYADKETGEVSSFNSTRATLKALAKYPGVMFMKRYRLPSESISTDPDVNPYHVQGYRTFLPLGRYQDWSPTDWAEPRKERDGFSDWWDRIKTQRENKKMIKKGKRDANKTGCWGANCYDDELSTAKGGGSIYNIPKFNLGGDPCYDAQGNVIPCPETTYTHEPGQRGSYRLQRTVTPYTSNRDIKRYTQAPTDPRQVNFIQNYAGAISGYQDDPGFNYPTQVPFEGAKHWNIDRFIIDPQFGGRTGSLHTTESTLEQNRANALADMYKYYMLQDPEHKGKAFRKAKRFVRKEVDPRIKGSFLPSYNSISTDNPDRFQIGYQGMDVYADQNKLKDLYFNELVGDGTPVTQDQIDKLKDVSMDYFRNYRKMSKKESNDMWNQWQEDADIMKRNHQYKIDNPNQPSKQVGWNVEYFDPISKKTQTKHFDTDEEAEEFYNARSKRALRKYSDLIGHKNGGDISIPDLQESRWLMKYGPGGATTDGCKPYHYKNAQGQCVPEFKLPDFRMPTNYSTDRQQVVVPMQENLEIQNKLAQQKAEAKRQFVGPAHFQTDDEKNINLQKKKNYVATHPNTKLDDNNNIVTINPDRDMEGRALPNTRAARTDKGLSHIMNAIETTAALTGAGQIGSNLVRLGASGLEKAIGRNLLSRNLKNFTSRINPTLNAIDEAGAYVQMDPIGIMGNRLNSKYYNPTTSLNTANNTITGVDKNLTNSAIEGADIVAGQNNLANLIENGKLNIPSITREDILKNVPVDDVVFRKNSLLPDQSYVKTRGRSLNYDQTIDLIHDTYTKYPELAAGNYPLYFHGSTSGSLPGFVSKKGLTPLGSLLKEGDAPLSGEIVFGGLGINKDHVSTAFLRNLPVSVQYSAPGKFVNPELNLKEWSTAGREKWLQDYPTDVDRVKMLDELYTNRAKKWQGMSDVEKQMAEENFPVLYGIKPKAEFSSGADRFKIPHSDIRDEVAFKGNIGHDEIPSIFVPKSKIDYVSKFIGNDKIHVLPIDDLVTRKKLSKPEWFKWENGGLVKFKPGGVTGDPNKPYDAKTNPQGYIILPNGRKVYGKTKTEKDQEKKQTAAIREYAASIPQTNTKEIAFNPNFNFPIANDSNSELVRQSKMYGDYSNKVWDQTKVNIANFKKNNPWAASLSDNDIVNRILLSNSSLQNQDRLTETSPDRSLISKAWAVASHPMTALKYKLEGQNIPDYFDRGEKNILDNALNIINPATYINSAASLGNAAIHPWETSKTLGKAGVNLLTNLANEGNVYNDESNSQALSLLGDVGNMFIAGETGVLKPVKNAINASKESGLLSNVHKLNPTAGKIPFVEGKPNWLTGWPKDYSDPTKIDFSGFSKFDEPLKVKKLEKLNKWWANLPVEKRLDKAVGEYYRTESNKLVTEAALKKTGLSNLFDVSTAYRPGVYSSFVAPLKNTPNIVFKYGREPFAGQTEQMVINNKVFNLGDETIGLPFHSQNINNRVASLMPKVTGEGSSFGITHTPDFTIPREAVAEMALKLRKLNKLGIHADWKGNNFMFNPETNQLSVFDLNMTPVENSGFAQRFASGTNKLGENPATIMRESWNLSPKPPRKITLDNIPEELGGYQGEAASTEMTGEAYKDFLRKQELEKQSLSRRDELRKFIESRNKNVANIKQKLQHGEMPEPIIINNQEEYNRFKEFFPDMDLNNLQYDKYFHGPRGQQYPIFDLRKGMIDSKLSSFGPLKPPSEISLPLDKLKEMKTFTGGKAFGKLTSSNLNKDGGSISDPLYKYYAESLNQYDPGGEVVEDDKPKKKTLLKNKRIGEIREPISSFNSRPIFPSTTYIAENIVDPTCDDPDGLGCSYQATRNAMKITNLPLQSYAPANAGYRDAVAEREGLQNIFNQEGEQKKWANSGNSGWKYPTFDDFKKWKAGDIVVLDAAGLDYFPYNAPPGFTEKDNSGASHNGVVVGFTESGVPIIKHGYATGKNKGRVITEVLGKGIGRDKNNNKVYRNWNDYRVSDLSHGRYAIKSVWRPKGVTDNDVVESVNYINELGTDRAANKEATSYPSVFGLNNTFEEQLQREAPIAAAFSGATTRLNTKKQLVDLFNNPNLDKQLQYELGIDAKTLQNLKPVIFGIAGQETNFNDVDNPFAAAKDVPGDVTNTGNSKGLFQIKYDSLTEDERKILGITSPNDLLDNKIAYKAAILMLSNAKNRMDSEVEKGTHPGLKNTDPYFRAAYYYNSPARAVSTAKEWAKGTNPFTINPMSLLDPFAYVSRETGNPNYIQQAELRMDEGSYPYKVMQNAKDLFMDNTSSEQNPETMEAVTVRALPKESKKKIKYYKD